MYQEYDIQIGDAERIKENKKVLYHFKMFAVIFDFKKPSESMTLFTPST